MPETDTGRQARGGAPLHRRQPQAFSPAILLPGVASLLWIPQAALLALAVQRLADGAGLTAMLTPAAGFLLLGVARATVDTWGARRIFAMARARLTALRTDAAAALAQRSPLDRERLPSGQAASLLAEQADAMLPWLTRYQPAQWRVLLVPPCIALVVAYQSWAAALVLVCAAPLIPLFMAIIGWRAKAASAQQLQALGGMNGFLLDRLRGLSTLRALGAVDATAHRVRETADTLRQRTMRVLRIAFLSSTALELFSSLAVALVAVYVGFHLLGQIGPGSWGNTLTLGEGLFILLLAPAFFEPLRDLSAAWHDKAAGQAASEALTRLHRDGLPLPGALDRPHQPSPVAPKPSPAPSTLAPPPAWEPPTVDLQDVSFRHAAEAEVFHAVNLHINAGEHVAIVGASGAGKTTLLSLIAGLAAVESGSVRIGGVPLDQHSAAALRRRMAWIGQQPHIFCGTVGSNVSLHRPGVTPDRVADAIRQAALEQAANAAPGDRLGEGGTGLSGGELVRLSLARAAVGQAELLLVDEPTAHLDGETAASVARAVKRLAQGRTLIVATHDHALAAQCDRIISLDEALAAAPCPQPRRRAA